MSNRQSARLGGYVILIENLDQEDIDNTTADKKWKLIERYLPDNDIEYVPSNGIHAITIHNDDITPTEINNTIKQINTVLHMKPKELTEMLKTQNIGELHYVAMYGDLLCLPDGCHSFHDRNVAIEWLIETLEMPPFGNKATELKTFGRTNLTKYAYGAEYASIEKCDCNTPEVHNDDN